MTSFHLVECETQLDPCLYAGAERQLTEFTRYVGIDYSGAETPLSSLKGLRIYMAGGDAKPVEVQPPPSPRKYWTRTGVAEWLVETLNSDVPTLVGIDHAFSFPIRYFLQHQVPLDWDSFLEDFHRHWPTDGNNTCVSFVRDGAIGKGSARTGNTRWRRLAEERAGGAKSVFHFDVPGQVATSTHAGLPWLLFIRRKLGNKAHFWPFDGWQIPAGKSVLAEVYPSIFRNRFARVERTVDQQDAYSTARWLAEVDQNTYLDRYFEIPLTDEQRKVAELEGWILGVA